MPDSHFPSPFPCALLTDELRIELRIKMRVPEPRKLRNSARPAPVKNRVHARGRIWPSREFQTALQFPYTQTPNTRRKEDASVKDVNTRRPHGIRFPNAFAPVQALFSRLQSQCGRANDMAIVAWADNDKVTDYVLTTINP